MISILYGLPSTVENTISFLTSDFVYTLSIGFGIGVCVGSVGTLGALGLGYYYYLNNKLKNSSMLSNAMYYAFDKFLTLKMHYEDYIQPHVEAYTPRIKNIVTSVGVGLGLGSELGAVSVHRNCRDLENVFCYNARNGELVDCSQIQNDDEDDDVHYYKLSGDRTTYNRVYIGNDGNDGNDDNDDNNDNDGSSNNNLHQTVTLTNENVPMDIQLIYNGNTYDIQEILSKFYVPSQEFDRAFFIAFMNYFYHVKIDNETGEFSLEIIDESCNIVSRTSSPNNAIDVLYHIRAVKNEVKADDSCE
jgi:hypothetical protein